MDYSTFESVMQDEGGGKKELLPSESSSERVLRREHHHQQIKQKLGVLGGVVLFVFFLAAALPSSPPSPLLGTTWSDAGFGYDAQVREHTTPTALSIVDPSTGKFIDALENDLYNRLMTVEMLEHRFLGHYYESENDHLPVLDLDKTRMTKLRDSLTVSWSGGDSILDGDDILALYCPAHSDHADFIEAATLQQVQATHQFHHRHNQNTSGYQQQQQLLLLLLPQRNHWHIPIFPITKHNTCQFRLFDVQQSPSTPQTTLQLVAISPTLGIPAATRTPVNIHMAFSNDPTEMIIRFRTTDSGTAVAKYGTDPAASNSGMAKGDSHTYSAHDMCGTPANITQVGKFQKPGMLHLVRLTNLQPSTVYFYRVGLSYGQGVQYSDIFNFTSAPAVGSRNPFQYLVYGDQGCPSVGWGDGGLWTSAMAARETSARAIHHFGDLSYARGAAHIWDEWLHMIEPFSTHLPLMVGVGNHEYDHVEGGANGRDPSGGDGSDAGFHPMWGNMGNDSGGECGVPASQHFTMPRSNNSNGVFWYSHDFASVHTIMLSSEHNMTKGSRQYEFLEQDLKHVNRTTTPWLVVELHRPMYESEFFWTQNTVGLGERMEIEDLLVRYQVDLVLAGHYHAYLRTCDGLYRSQCHEQQRQQQQDYPGGPTHITVGSAGAILDRALLYPQTWTKVYVPQKYGYGRITVANASHLRFQWILAGSKNDTEAGSVGDDVWIVRDR